VAEGKYSKYIVTDLILPEEIQAGAADYARWATRILWLDEDVVPGSFQVNCSWYRKPTEMPSKAHTHDYDEVIAFFGGDLDNPHDLYGEVEFWIENEKYILDRSTLIFVPGGLKHCPVQVLRADKPIFHFTVVMGGKYIPRPVDELKPTTTGSRPAHSESKYEKYILQELRMPEGMMPSAEYMQRATKVLWMDGENTPGAFNVNVTWLWKATDFNHDEAHKHDYDEVIGFFGSDLDRPSDLNAEVEFWLEDEKYILTKSTLLFIPEGLTHCPLRVLSVNQPIFHFTIVRSGTYKQNLIAEG
jgi:quercetin dioxygenase-like cupin family protein